MKKATLKQAAKLLSIFENVPAEQMQAVLESGILADVRDADLESVNRRALRAILGLKPLNEVRVLSVWKTIQLGNGLKSSEDFQRAFEQNRCRLALRGHSIIGAPDFTASISPVAASVKLCLATTEELVGRTGTLEEVCAGIKKVGGGLLPIEAGPQLRLQYLDQPKGESLFMVNEEKNFSGCHSAWMLERNDSELWLLVSHFAPGLVIRAGVRWVFAIR